MEIINFFKNYWTQIIFICGMIATIYKLTKLVLQALKCSLRNDILSIYDYCKKDKKITQYQLQALHYSYDVYKKLKGNSFVKDIVEEVDKWEKIN